ncbi:MAG: TerC family protein [Methylobacterium sp.]|jgi:YjbE family integral membrane protein|nr:TerC family protein [Methylobacterium sp.]MCA3627078.1 TerC family protein [Methylobacterium sp.]
MEWITPYLAPLFKIIWIDLLLSGDNAVVIALACRALPPEQRRMGMILGAGAAIGLRIIFAIFITYLLNVPFLKVVGGLLLLWIGVKLAVGEDEDAHSVESSDNLWRAVRTIAIADAVMSLDNVLAIAAAAGGNIWLFVFGLLLSIPLIIFGSQLLSTLIDRFPVIVWGGAALLGWIAGEMLVTDPIVMDWIKGLNPAYLTNVQESDGHGGIVSKTMPIAVIFYGAAVVGAAAVLGIGRFMKGRKAEAV